MRIPIRFLLPALVIFAFFCLAMTYRAVEAAPPVTTLPAGKPITIKAPLGLPPVPIPPDNPPTAETVALGRRLYYDPQLSVDGTISCASCHAPEFAFSDQRPFSAGVGGKPGEPTRSPSTSSPNRLPRSNAP